MYNTQFQLPALTRTNKIIMIATVAAFIAQSIASAFLSLSMTPLFGLSGIHFQNGFYFQLLTYPFVGTGLIEVIFNALIFWFIGVELEVRWGKVRYISFLFASLLGGGLIYLLLSNLIFSGSAIFEISLTGMSGVTGSLLLAYAMIFPDRLFTFMLIIPMKAKYFCMIMIGILVYMGIFSAGGVQAWGHLGAMISGFFYLAYISRSQYVALRKQNQKKKSSHLRIVEKEDKNQNPPKYWH